MSAILLRDLRSYAVTMTGWVFVAFILVFMGIFTMTYNLTGGYGNFEYVLSELKIVYLVGVPVLTMRSFAEERRSHTDQLLYALPLSSGSIVVLTIAILLAGAGLTALTRNGIFAFGLAALAEVVLVAVFLINGGALEGLVGDMLSGLSLFDRFSPFVNGIVDLASITFYLAVSAVFVFLTIHVFDSRRWR